MNEDLDILLDQSSIELLINEGQFVIKEQIFPTKPCSKLKLLGYNTDKQGVENNSISRIGSI